MRRDYSPTGLIQTLLVLWCAVPAMQAQPAFEAVSIRPSAIQANGRYGNYRMAGGPGTNDPGRMVLENFDIRSLITKAYDLPFYCLIAPEWLFDIRFDINANIPAGTTKEQFLAMQQNLLATRLGLVVHREKKEMSVYELIVAKGGSKLKEAAPAGELADTPSFAGGIKRDDEGFPILTPGHTMYAIAMDHARLQGVSETMEHFAATLSGQLSAPVTDATGLTGKYDFTFQWLPGNLRPDDDPGLSLESALPQQLGLTLRKTRGRIDVVVVDHVDKVPTEN
jgi:bla regulator protein blaR1